MTDDRESPLSRYFTCLLPWFIERSTALEEALSRADFGSVLGPIPAGCGMIKTDQTVLVLIDIQGKLAQLMHERQALFDNLRRVVQGAQTLGLPILWLEQYPQGLGPTIPEVATLLPGLKPIEKTCFSACGNETFLQQLTSIERRQVLLAGIEAHVCVYQTARDLLAAGYEVEVVADAVSSRTAANAELGRQRMRDAGARLTSVEMALFELLRTAEARAFKDVARIVR